VVARRLAALGGRIVLVGHEGYPPRLADAWPELGAPPWLLVKGSLAADAPAVAVVGTRQPTLDGLRTAGALGRLLARHGIVVVSGMARGIDQAAHRAALEGGGRTIAVLGTGFGVDYPSGSAALQRDVAANGGCVTELAPGSPPRPHHFLARNRIISGLADATVVVEGRSRSGALQTARLAAAQGREVFAVPGSLNAPTSRGPLDLIRDGARPLALLEDILEVLDLPGVAVESGEPSGEHDGAVQLGPAADVLALIGPTPSSAGELARTLGRPVGDVLTTLAELTARGLVQPTPRGVVRAANRRQT